MRDLGQAPPNNLRVIRWPRPSDGCAYLHPPVFARALGQVTESDRRVEKNQPEYLHMFLLLWVLPDPGWLKKS